MKRLVLAVFILLALATMGHTASTTATATWQQVIPSPATVFGGWEIWMSDSAAGTYTMLVNIPYVSTQTTYTTTQTITVPDGVATTKYFKILAWNKSGKKSAFTPPVSATVDFEATPAVPITFTITIATP